MAEGNERPLVSWLLDEGIRWKLSGGFVTPTKATFHASDAYGCRVRRRHDLLSGLIEGHVHLSLDRNPASAIRCLRDLIDLAVELEIEGSLHLAGAMTILHKTLQSESIPPITSSQFDEYLSLAPKSSTRTITAERICTAKLFHPVTPNPWPMFLRMEPHMANLRGSQQIGPALWNKWGLIYFRTLLLLQLEGAIVEAKVICEMLQAEFGPVWHNRRDIVNRFRKDPKLTHILARSREMADKGRQHSFLGLRSKELPGDDSAFQEIEGLLTESEPEIEELAYDVSSELLELRSRRRR